MTAAKEKDIDEILQYLKPHAEDCVYMYIDIKKYGLGNPNMSVWIDRNYQGIYLVVMKYHTSISVYTREENWDVDAVSDIIRREKPESVTAPRAIVEALQNVLSEEYGAVYGSVFELTNIRQDRFDGEIERVGEADTKEIAELIVRDEGIGGYYNVADLAEQFTERMRTNMGRNYVIRDHGRIVAHIASYAEYDGIATTGGLIVDPAYQTGVYGAVLESYLVEQLKKEGFRIYTFVTERLRKLFLTAVGNPCVGEYGKMTRKSEID